MDAVFLHWIDQLWKGLSDPEMDIFSPDQGTSFKYFRLIVAKRFNKQPISTKRFYTHSDPG